MKVLFIGGTGVISSSASEYAVSKGIDLYLLNRGTRSEFTAKGASVIKGDIRDIENTAEILKKYEFDVVIDWVAYTPENIRADLKLFSGRVGQYIFISSASAYQKPPKHYLIDESTPLCNPYWQYSKDKIACEDLLMNQYRDNGFPVTIVRPSYTYDKTLIPFIFNSRKYRWTLIDRIRKGKKIIVPGDGTSLWTLTHSSDFAKGIVGLLGNNKTIGNAFHITSDEVLTWDQIVNSIGEAAGRKPEIIHIASEFMGAFAPEYAGGLLGDKSVSVVFDNSKIKRFVPDFCATMPFYKGIRQSIEWHEANEDLCLVDDEFDDLSDRIIDVYEKALSMAKA
jgi:nucleoside-diphosphate-sugar epimerase